MKEEKVKERKETKREKSQKKGEKHHTSQKLNNGKKKIIIRKIKNN